MLPKQPAPADPAGPEPRETVRRQGAAPDEAAPPADDAAPATSDAGDAGDAAVSPAGGEPGDGCAAAAAPAAPARKPTDPARAKQVRRLTVLAAAALVLLAAAALLAFGNHETRTSGVLGNDAIVDSAGTAEAVSQLTAAVKTVYSYDYRLLEKTETDAKQLITGEFAGEFDRIFGPVKELAPKEQAVLNTEVPAAGVMQLSGDQARLLMMVDQRGTRAGNQPLPPVSARLVVEAQRVDGRWKISGVTPV